MPHSLPYLARASQMGRLDMIGYLQARVRILEGIGYDRGVGGSVSR